MLKKGILLLTLAALGVFAGGRVETGSAAQDPLASYKGNNCVECHAKLTTPLRLTSHYADWYMSTHKDKEVSCEKCHGGDPKLADGKTAHVDVAGAADAKSRLHPQNLPETCNACHQGVVSSFVESKHYQKLKSAGIGPSCTTCHQHMASQVLYTPEETSAMCATCHNSPNKLMPPSPVVPEKAAEAMMAIRRANAMALSTDRLFEEADKRKLSVGDELREFKIARAVLAEAKISFHAFNLDIVRRKADESFELSSKVKTVMRAKLYPQQ